MPTLQYLPGFRILEAALRSPDFALPGGISSQTYAEFLALREFGHSLSSPLPPYPCQDASDAEFSRYYALHDEMVSRFRCDLLDGAAALSFFDKLQWDLSDDQRHFSLSGRLFARLIEAMALGVVGCSPNQEIETWRQSIRRIDDISIFPANDHELECPTAL